MASPQKENGFTPISNELLEAWIHITESVSSRVLMWVARNTYGWSRSTCKFNWSKVAKDINARRSNVSICGRALIAKNILFLTKEGEVGIQKNYDQWGGSVEEQCSSPVRGLDRHAERSSVDTLSVPPQDPKAFLRSNASTVELKKERNLKKGERKGNAPTEFNYSPPDGFLPTGKPDTTRNRGVLWDAVGHYEYIGILRSGLDWHPAGAPDYQHADRGLQRSANKQYDDALIRVNDPAAQLWADQRRVAQGLPPMQ